MNIILTLIHVIAGLALIIIVLLQTSKGASMGAAFGGSSRTLFGARGAGGFLGKLTTGVAIAFMLTSLSLAFLSSRGAKSSIALKEETTQTVKVEPEKGDQTSGTSEAESKKDGSDEEGKPQSESEPEKTDQTSNF